MNMPQIPKSASCYLDTSNKSRPASGTSAIYGRPLSSNRGQSKNKINQSSFAEMLGVSRTYVNKVIKGRRTPSFKLTKKIQEVTNGLVTLDDFTIVEKC